MGEVSPGAGGLLHASPEPAPVYHFLGLKSGEGCLSRLETVIPQLFPHGPTSVYLQLRHTGQAAPQKSHLSLLAKKFSLLLSESLTVNMRHSQKGLAPGGG